MIYTAMRERCAGCGDCVAACPVHAVRQSDGRAHIDGAACIGCHACVEVCPEGAIFPAHALATRAPQALPVASRLGQTLPAPRAAQSVFRPRP